MKRFLLLLALLASFAAPAAIPSAEPAPVHFVAPAELDLPAILPAPPAPGSLAAQADLETVLRAQVARTPSDLAWAKFIERDTVFNHAAVLGSWFSADKLPATAEFLRHVSDDMYAASRGAKELYPRARPFRTDPAVHPCVGMPDSNSYPSGHSMQAFTWAMVLGDIFPDQREALLERAHQAAWGRVIGGVHFPSDLVGGRLLAEAFVAALRKKPEYQAGIEKCRAEAEQLRHKKAA